MQQIAEKWPISSSAAEGESPLPNSFVYGNFSLQCGSIRLDHQRSSMSAIAPSQGGQQLVLVTPIGQIVAFSTDSSLGVSSNTNPINDVAQRKLANLACAVTIALTTGSAMPAVRSMSDAANANFANEISISYLANEKRGIVSAPPNANEPPLVRAIRDARTNAKIDDDATDSADVAMSDAVMTIERNEIATTPLIMFADDGALTLQWQSHVLGLALIFAGDGYASIAFRQRGQLYAENGLDVHAGGELPEAFFDMLSNITTT